MKMQTKLVALTAVFVGLGGIALAHGHGDKGPGCRHAMMPGMMRMHAQMMDGDGPMAGMGVMGGHGMGMGMMGTAMERFDADGDGNVTPEEARAGLQALLKEYDANGDQTLSLSEFEKLHSAMIRKTMVDRFQFLDDDGDGAVTMDEIVKPAEMMGRMQQMHERMMSEGMMGGPRDGMHGHRGMMGAPGEGQMGNN